jgi:glycosyltransferase involved in cell wall biosynthesis
VRQSAAIVAIGRHMGGYIEHHLGRRAEIIHPPIYGGPPFPRFGSFNRGRILMINPSVVKGIRIFLALADRFQHYEFAALTGWATTKHDRKQLLLRANVTVLQSVPAIDDVLAQARLLLMPSLWYEGFGLIAMEAMLRGLPVISSDSGGLQEAKRGTGFVIPVRPIHRFERVFDETHMPRAVEVEQDIEPWAEALETLLTNEAIYLDEAERSRRAAIAFVSELRASDFEDLLMRLEPNTAADRAMARHDHLSPVKRALLLRRLRKQ